MTKTKINDVHTSQTTVNQPLTVLIPRPEKPAQALASLLNQHDIPSVCHAMFHYQPSISLIDCQNILAKQRQPILIFISVAAVEYANELLPLTQWQCSQIIAVGTATQRALVNLKQSATCPEIHDTDGMLNLSMLKNVQDQDVVIVRGNGGRERLAQQLTKRGANVSYIETYQRIWQNLTATQIDYWRAQNINCIVVTSNALLESLVHLLLANDLSASDKHWKNSCLWIVASERIATTAKNLGVKHVINASGADNESILSAIAQTE